MGGLRRAVGRGRDTAREVQMTRLPKKVLFRVAIAAMTLVGLLNF